MNTLPDMGASAMFAAGAVSKAMGAGLSVKDAEALSMDLLEKAAYDEYDDDSTFWSRNKGWIIPALVGGAAFWAGASGERHGRNDRGYIRNAWNNIRNRAMALLGINHDPVVSTMTDTPEFARYHRDPDAHLRNWGDFSTLKDTTSIA